MPTYQYTCTECGHFFEQVQSFTDDALTDCPSCSGRLRKVFNAVGVVFKGSGFYHTDSRPSGRDGRDGKDGSDSSGDGASKPAAAAASSKPAAEKGRSDRESSSKKPSGAAATPPAKAAAPS